MCRSVVFNFFFFLKAAKFSKWNTGVSDLTNVQNEGEKVKPELLRLKGAVWTIQALCSPYRPSSRCLGLFGPCMWKLSGYILIKEYRWRGGKEFAFLISPHAVPMLLSLSKSLDDVDVSSNGPPEVLSLFYSLIPIFMNLLTTEANHKEHCSLPITSEEASLNHGISIEAPEYDWPGLEYQFPRLLVGWPWQLTSFLWASGFSSVKWR